MLEGKTWKTAGEQEDWLRTKGTLLGYITEVLANRLRDEIPTLPAKAEYLVFGYITPVASEYVRRAIWGDTALSEYQKQMLELFTVRTYDYVINHYRGHLPNAEQCIDELLGMPMPLSDPAFFARMHRVTPYFDEHFRPGNRDDNLDDDMVFGTAFLAQVFQIVKESSGAVLSISAQDCTQMLQVFNMTARTIRQMLAD